MGLRITTFELYISNILTLWGIEKVTGTQEVFLRIRQIMLLGHHLYVEERCQTRLLRLRTLRMATQALMATTKPQELSMKVEYSRRHGSCKCAPRKEEMARMQVTWLQKV